EIETGRQLATLSQLFLKAVAHVTSEASAVNGEVVAVEGCIAARFFWSQPRHIFRGDQIAQEIAFGCKEVAEVADFLPGAVALPGVGGIVLHANGDAAFVQ